MQTIYKYILHDTQLNKVELPSDYTVLNIVEQLNRIVLYCIVDPDAPKVEANFYVVGTGWDMPDGYFDGKDYIGTVTTHSGTYVWHVFQGYGEA